MNVFPAYTYFDRTQKVVCDITIFGGDTVQESGVKHSHPVAHNKIRFNDAVEVVPSTAAAITTEMKESQAKTVITNAVNGDTDSIIVSIEDGINSLNDIEPKDGWGSAKWMESDYNTGEDTIEGISYINRGTKTILDAEDIADTEALVLPALHMFVLVKADLTSTIPATFRLEKGKKSINFVINAVDAE